MPSRTIYGASFMILTVVEFTMKTGIFASVETRPTATASGEYAIPMITSTWSLMISSCAMRRAVSGLIWPVSRRISSTLRPATVSPCSFWKAAMPKLSPSPARALSPLKENITPIFSGGASTAPARCNGNVNSAKAASAETQRCIMPGGYAALI